MGQCVITEEFKNYIKPENEGEEKVEVVNTKEN